MSPQRRLVLVTWIDSFNCTSSWNSAEPSETQKRQMVCKSVGWLTHHGEETLVVAPHMTTPFEGETGQSCGEMSIPVCSLLSVTDLVVTP